MQGDRVSTFEHRPFLETWANAGHCVFSKEVVRKYFLEEGDFEHSIIQQIAEDKRLKGLTYDRAWLTLNTMKDLIRIRGYFTPSRGVRDGYPQAKSPFYMHTQLGSFTNGRRILERLLW
jgi:NDP-sugar pyrophosphorylase family protein